MCCAFVPPPCHVSFLRCCKYNTCDITTASTKRRSDNYNRSRVTPRALLYDWQRGRRASGLTLSLQRRRARPEVLIATLRRGDA